MKRLVCIFYLLSLTLLSAILLSCGKTEDPQPNPEVPPTIVEIYNQRLSSKFKDIEGKKLTGSDTVMYYATGIVRHYFYPLGTGQSITFSDINFADSTAILHCNAGEFDLSSIDDNPAKGKVWSVSVLGVPYDVAIPITFNYSFTYQDSGQTPFPIYIFSGEFKDNDNNYCISGYFSESGTVIETSYTQNKHIDIEGKTLVAREYEFNPITLDYKLSVFNVEGADQLVQGIKASNLIQLVLNTPCLPEKEYISKGGWGYITLGYAKQANNAFSVASLVDSLGNLNFNNNVMSFADMSCLSYRESQIEDRTGDPLYELPHKDLLNSGYKFALSPIASPFRYSIVDKSNIKLYIYPRMMYQIFAVRHTDIYKDDIVGVIGWRNNFFYYNKPSMYQLISDLLIAEVDELKGGIDISYEIGPGNDVKLNFSDSEVAKKVLGTIITAIIDNPENYEILCAQLEGLGLDSADLNTIKTAVKQLPAVISSSQNLKFGLSYNIE